MATYRLTKQIIERLESDSPVGTRYFDEDLTGFGIKVFPSGTRKWFIMYRTNGHKRDLVLGRYPTLTPDEARKMAKKKLAEVTNGADPAEERAKARQIPTFKAWVDTYLEHVQATKKRPEDDKRYLEKAAKVFGMKKLTDVDSADIDAIIEEYRKDGKPVAANRFLASIRACLQRAWRHPYKYITDNPARHLQPGKDATPRDRVLTDEEMKRLAAKLAEMADVHMRAAFVIAAETGVRASEVLACRWEDFDLKEKIWRLPDTKSGKPQFVPLTKALVDYLKTVPRLGPYLVPGRKENTARSRTSLSKLWATLRAAAELPDVHFHDLRRTFGLRIARKASLDVASKLLRHSSVKVTEKSYAPFGLDDLRPSLDQGGRVIPMIRKQVQAAAKKKASRPA